MLQYMVKWGAIENDLLAFARAYLEYFKQGT
jgi:hypothetical protein